MFWDAFSPQQIFADLVFDISSVPVLGMPKNSEWNITKSPLDNYAAIRNLKSAGLTLSAAQDSSSGNDTMLGDIMHEI